MALMLIDIRESIRTAVTKGGIRKTEIAEEAGLHVNSLTGIEKDDWNPRLTTVESICKAISTIKARRA
jgi:DNA-binding XRE family transcriptional regulator